MAESIDELGPIDYLVIEFPGSRFNGKIAPELAKLVEDGLIRVLDLLVVKKDEDGTVEGFEVSDLDPDEHGGIHELDVDIAELLSEEDVLALAEAVEPGSSAGILVYENTWAAPFRVRGPAIGRPARRERPHPRPGDHCLPGRRRS